MELINKSLTKVVVYVKGKSSAVFNPPLEEGAVAERTKREMLQHAEIRSYYYPDKNLEVIRTLVPPFYTQLWHTHEKIHEAMLVLEGEILVKEEKHGKILKTRLHEGDLVVVEKGLHVYHTVENPTGEYSTTLTFKFISPDKKQSECFESDWHGKE